jgi:hypothetical protein
MPSARGRRPSAAAYVCRPGPAHPPPVSWRAIPARRSPGVGRRPSVCLNSTGTSRVTVYVELLRRGGSLRQLLAWRICVAAGDDMTQSTALAATGVRFAFVFPAAVTVGTRFTINLPLTTAAQGWSSEATKRRTARNDCAGPSNARHSRRRERLLKKPP